VYGPLRLAAVLLLAVGGLLTLAGLGIALLGLLWPEVVVRQLPADIVSADAVAGALIAGGAASASIGLAHVAGGYRCWRGRTDAGVAFVAVGAAAIGIAFLGSAVAAVVEVGRGGDLLLATLALALAVLGLAELTVAISLAVARARSAEGGDVAGPG